MKKRNVTLSLPSELLKRVKVLAAERETSVSALMRELLEDFVRREDDYWTVWEEEKKVLREGLDMRVGEITWTRDEVHDRRY